MKIAVFSDIHGNLKALKNVLAQIKEQNVDKVVFLGDIFQRGNEELECLDLIKENKIICVKGNCEFYLQYGIDIDTGVEHLRAYYDTTRVKLSDEQMQFVKDMPLYYVNECNGHKIRFSHFLFADINAPYPFLQLLFRGLRLIPLTADVLHKEWFRPVFHTHHGISYQQHGFLRYQRYRFHAFRLICLIHG